MSKHGPFPEYNHQESQTSTVLARPEEVPTRRWKGQRREKDDVGISYRAWRTADLMATLSAKHPALIFRASPRSAKQAGTTGTSRYIGHDQALCRYDGEAFAEPYTRQQTLTDHFASTLGDLIIPAEIVDWLATEISSTDETQASTRVATIKRHEAEQASIQRRLGTLYEDRLDGTITKTLPR